MTDIRIPISLKIKLSSTINRKAAVGALNILQLFLMLLNPLVSY